MTIRATAKTTQDQTKTRVSDHQYTVDEVGSEGRGCRRLASGPAPHEKIHVEDGQNWGTYAESGVE